MFDFNKSFADFVKKHMQSEKMSYEDIEDIIADLSVEWAIIPLDALGGKSPTEYIDSLSDARLLVDLLIMQSDSSVMPQLEDKIIETPATTPILIDRLSADIGSDAKKNILRMLIGQNEMPPSGLLFDCLLSEVGEDDLVRSYVSWMSFSPDKTVDELLRDAIDFDEEKRAIVGEILSYAKKDDRIYLYLVELFYSINDLPHMASLFARYGDERAIEVLKSAAEDCNYFEFIELRNAIEALGGELDTNRDWSDDEYYKKLMG